MLKKILYLCLFCVLFQSVLAPCKTVAQKNTGKQPQYFKEKENLGLTQEELEFLAKNPVIRVGNEEDWAPFDFNKHGMPQGYAIDHLELLGRKLGISFKYINGYTWAELLDLFKKKKIDLLPSLWISEGRKQYMLFTEPFLQLPYVLVTENGNTAIHNFSDLKDKTVAVAKSYKQEEVLSNNHPEIKLHLVKNALEGLKAVSYGHADAYIGYRGTVDYLIATRFFTDLEIKGEIDVPELGPQGLYISVQKDMKPLQSALQKAMDSMDNREKVRLAREWITINKSPSPSLDKKEKEYLKNNPVLTVDNLDGWPPFNFRENNIPKGFCIEYMQLLANKLDVRLDFVSGHAWNKYLDMLKHEKIDILCDVVETKDRQNYIHFTRPYFVIFTGIVVKKENRHLSDLESLAGKKVAVPKDFYHEEILKRDYPDVTVVTEENTLNCLKSVSSGQTDAALAEKPVFDYLISKHFLLDLKSIPLMDNVHFENTPVSIGVSKEQKILQNILQKTMDTVTEEELKTLKNKWLQTDDNAEKNALEMAFSADERRYLAVNEELQMCVQTPRLPMENMDGEKYSGIIADIVSVISKRTGIRFTPVSAQDWKECVSKVEAGECDIVSSLPKNAETAEHFIFSKPFLQSARVMVALEDEQYIAGISSLQDKKVGIVQGDPVEEYIKTNYPQIKIVHTRNPEELLREVSEGHIDVAIAGLQMVSYKIHEHGLYNLKIVGQTPFKKFFRMGVKKENPELRSILNKAIDSVSSLETNRIIQNQLGVEYEPGLNYSLLWKIALFVATVLGAILFWNRKLFRLNQKIAQAHEELAQKNLELERLSITDKLTGTYNRLHLEAVLEQECERSRRYNEPLSLIMADIDDFKEVNDLHGHQRGDEVLREVAANLCTSIRKTDTAGRWGGEEFLIICPETDLTGASKLADKLQKRIENLTLEEVDGITCSFGAVEIRKGESSDSLMSRADKLLYQAKDQGKNKVICDR